MSPWTPRLFAWQAWHLATCSCTLRGRRGTLRHPPSSTFVHLRFTWQAWHVWHWAGSGGALGSHMSPWTPRLFAWQAWHLATCSCTLRGRRGTLRHPPSSHVAGVARMALGWLWWHAVPSSRRLFAWQAWHLATCSCTLRGRRCTLRHPPSSTFVSRGRRGTYGTGLALVARSVPTCRRGRRGFLRGRRGTFRHVAALCVAGLAL